MNIKTLFDKKTLGYEKIDLFGEIAIYLIHREDNLERTLYKIWDKDNKDFSYGKVMQEIRNLELNNIFPFNT